VIRQGDPFAALLDDDVVAAIRRGERRPSDTG
jgi:hypothetical protein